MAFLRITLVSIGQALGAPRVVLFAWLVIAVAAATVVWPALAATETALLHHPGAGSLQDQALDSDLRRLQPEATLQLEGAWLLGLFLFLWLGGGILSHVGRGERVSFTHFLSSCGGLFLRNLRVLILGCVPAALLFWGVDAFRGWAGETWLVDQDPGAVLVPLWIWDLRWDHLLFAGDLFRGLLFLGVAFAAKVAMAEFVVHGRRSALVAWLTAAGHLLRRPLRCALVLLALSALWMAGAFLVGMGTTWAAEVRGDLWLGLLFGQLGALWNVVAVVALFLAARHFVEPDVDGLPALPRPDDLAVPEPNA